MKCHPRTPLFALLVFAAVFYCGILTGHSTELQQAKPAVQQEEQESPPGYEDEYNAWANADKEPDLLKRGEMVIAAMEKYPKSTLMPNFEATYRNLLLECSNGKKYQELETLAERWQKLHPKDLQTIAYIATAAKELGQDEKYVQSLLEIYKLQPTGDLARDIAQAYNRMKDKAKYLEWIETALKYPEYETNFMLRSELVQYYADENNFIKAGEWAQAAIKATEAVKDPSEETQKQMRAVRRACYDLIGRSRIERDKFADAIKAFQQALKIEKYSEGYYYTALCLRKLDKIDDAIIWYAKAELQGGEGRAPKLAKENLEQVYKALHNQTLIGIEKVYKKARELPDSYWTSPIS